MASSRCASAAAAWARPACSKSFTDLKSEPKSPRSKTTRTTVQCCFAEVESGGSRKDRAYRNVWHPASHHTERHALCRFCRTRLCGFRWSLHHHWIDSETQNPSRTRRGRIGIFATCCARAPSGHATTAPPSATSNSRRPMVTVIRPSRARCVEGTIPRHECAVLTARHPARAGRAPGTGCDGAPTVAKMLAQCCGYSFSWRLAELPDSTMRKNVWRHNRPMRSHPRGPKSPMRFLVAVALTALIASPSVAADRDAKRIVTRHVASIVPPDGAGGVAVALRIEGQSLFFNYGWADRANKRPITTDTLFNLASLRKVFEATLLAQAVRKGDLGLDDPVAKYVVELQQGGDIRQVTLGQ